MLQMENFVLSYAYSIAYIYIFFYPFVFWCFFLTFWATVNYAAINVGMHASFQIMVSFG